MESIELTFDENKVGDGVTAISLVERPAIKVNWMAFSDAQPKEVHFATVDEDQQMIAGPVMIPDMDILRIDPSTGEKFTVFYKADTIQRMNEHFIKGGKQTSATIEHQMTLNGVSVVETWIIADSNNDKANHYGFNLPAGTWFVVMKIDDPKVWNAVKEGVVKGFSLEGYFGEEKKTEFNDSLISMLKTNIIEAFKQVFAASEQENNADESKQEFASVTVTDTEGNAVELNFTGDALEVGAEIQMTNTDGEESPVADGVYTLEDGRMVTVADSVVTEIADAPEESEDMSADEKSDAAETFSSKEFENKMLNVFEKFGDMIDKKIDEKFEQSQNELKNLRSELSEIPGAEALPDSPKDSGEKKKWVSWKKFTEEQKKNK